jgi:hypothetical protein
MTAGDCFYGVLPGSGKTPHYWIVLADPCPAGMVALVNFTTPTGAPMAHCVTRQFFPTLKYDSEAAWSYATLQSAAAITKAIAANIFTVQKGLKKSDLSVLIKGGLDRGLVPREVIKKICVV